LFGGLLRSAVMRWLSFELKEQILKSQEQFEDEIASANVRPHLQT
jgi:hypothetical protein